MYKKYFKRLFDFAVSLIGLIAISPIFLILIVTGWIIMKGNPFFTQQRPGKNEKVFLLLKFRTMTCERDENGELLPDEQRITKYGSWLRSTSLDELPELINILVGHMSIVGPRPLLVKYLPLYNERQKHRHDVRPGLTGLAQVKGRNRISFEERFELDLEYIQTLSLKNDILIILETVKTVLKHEGITSSTSETMEEFKGTKEKVTTYE